MGRKRKRQKRNPERTLENKCKKLWSLIVRANAGNSCELCGATEYIQAHHIIGKRFKLFRFLVENGLSVCASCHKFTPGAAAHENPIRVYTHMMEHRPNDLKILSGKVKVPEWTNEKYLVILTRIWEEMNKDED